MNATLMRSLAPRTRVFAFGTNFGSFACPRDSSDPDTAAIPVCLPINSRLLDPGLSVIANSYCDLRLLLHRIQRQDEIVRLRRSHILPPMFLARRNESH